MVKKSFSLDDLKTHKPAPRFDKKPLYVSLRFKLAVPVLILVTLMLILLFRTTFRTVRELMLDRVEKRLESIAEVFAETVKVPLIFYNEEVLSANIEWMTKRKDVFEVQIEDAEGIVLAGAKRTKLSLLTQDVASPFIGVRRLRPDIYAVAVPIEENDKRFGRVIIVFSQQGLETELREIFQTRLLMAFIMALILALLTAGITWLAIRPILKLKQAAQDILTGNLSARARIRSFDEIGDVADAFNEMVSRLTRSLDNLRSRTEALEESEEKYRLIVENASDIIFTFTADGELVLLNKGFSGCSREEILVEGLPLILALHNETTRIDFEKALEQVALEKKPVHNVALTHLHRGNQTEVFYLTNLTPVLNPLGEVKMIQGVMRDVTELRQIEIMKDSLIRDVAHELKTPTAKFEMALSWFEQELKKNQEIEKYREVVSMLINNSDRLMRTINSILDLTKLESGMHHIETQTLNLNEVLEQVATDMRLLCQQKNLELETSFSKSPLMMKGDRDMLYRLFVNLIGNSLKFTQEGKISISSRALNHVLVVKVRDTGMGIEKEYLEKVFDRFFQKTASSVGIGVGLTISRDIAVLHQGKIMASSEGIGKGAEFTIEFPRL